MRRVILESPYHAPTPAEIEANREYARGCLKDCLVRGEAPLASHLLYTQVLQDDHKPDRFLGMNAGLVWIAQADASVVYYDFGVSRGMVYGIAHARLANVPVEYRKLQSNTACMSEAYWADLNARVNRVLAQAEEDRRRWACVREEKQ